MELATLFAKHRIDSGLTAQDQLRARSMIKIFDKDFNGVATKEETESVSMPTIQSTRLGDAQKADVQGRESELKGAQIAGPAQALLQFDADKDGEVKLTEIEEAFSKRRDEMGYSPKHAAAASKIFLRHDTDKDRGITKRELKDESEAGYLTKDDLVQIDRNSDKAIDHDELARHLARQSTKLSQ